MHIPSIRAVPRSVIVLLAVVALLLAARAALPYVITDYLNDVLNRSPDYSGEVADVDVHLWRGAYSVHGIRIDQLDEGEVRPLFNAQSIDLSVAWGALVHGNLVGDVLFVRPKLNLVTAPRPEDLKEEKFRLEDLVDRFKEFLPLDINRFAVTAGELHFQDVSADPDIDLYIGDIELVARNLTNSEELSESLWATVSGTGRLMGSGEVTLEMRFNPSEPQPTYQLAFQVKELRLTALNDYLKHYLSVAARDGRLSLSAESTAEKGRFRGYVKPVVKDLDVLQLKPEPKSAGEAIKGFFVKLLSKVFENKPEEQLATRLEFSGSFENPEVSVWEAVTTFVRNAFVRALQPGLEGSVAPAQTERVKRNDTETGASGSGPR